MLFSWRLLLLFYYFFMISVSMAFAQNTLSVQVRNIEDNSLASNIGVIVKSQDLGQEQSQITNQNGKAVFRLNSAGLYQVFVAKSAIFKGIDTLIVRINEQEQASAVLFISQQIQELPAIVLSGKKYSVASLNTENAQVSSELQSAELQQLPIEGRDISRALFRLPNITQATGFYPEAPTVAINGANSLFTNYLIDGFDNNENFLGGMRFNVPIGFVENLQVLTNNFSAEYGNTANGIINISSKMGSNKTKGELFYQTRPGAIIDAKSPYAQRDLSGNMVKDGFMRQQLGFGIGGALKPNKTFYFLNFEYTLDVKDNLLNVPELGINETVRGQNQFAYLSAKIDQFWNEKWHSSLRFNVGKVNIERQGGGLDGGATFPSAGNTQWRNSAVLASKNEYFGKNFTSQTNFQIATFQWNYAQAINENSPNVTVYGPTNQVLAILGHPGYSFNEYENTTQIQQKYTFNLRKHNLKVGAEVKSSAFELFGGGNPNGSYNVQLNQLELNELRSKNLGSNLGIDDIPETVEVLSYQVELRPNSFKKRQNIYSLYLEDNWNITEALNLNIGLRYDYDNLSKGGGAEGDKNNIAPRFSFNYKINEKTAIRGGYGMYYEKILYAVWSDAMQFSSNNQDYIRQIEELVSLGILPKSTDVSAVLTEGNLTANGQASYLKGPKANELADFRNSAFSNERRILNPNGYQNPFSHQFMLGYQNQVNKNMLCYVDVVYNQSFNLFRINNLNAPSPYIIDPQNVVPRTDADASRAIPIYEEDAKNFAIIGTDTLYGIARNIVMTETKGQSKYLAASFTLNKERGDDNFGYRLSYTLSKLENNTEDINFRAMDANNFDDEWGPSINDRTHLINAFLSFYPTKNLQITTASLLQSGQPINRIPDALLYGTTDLNGDGRSFGDAYVGNSDRSPGESRNSDRLPWSNTFDLGAQYQIPIKGGGKMEIRADVFNIFNAVNLSGYANNATQSNQIQVGPASSGLLVRRNAAPPRQFQFGIRYVF